MNINFLYKNALPRGADVFLKMVVTVTALLCSHWTVYGQPTLPTPADGADVEIPVTLQWSTNSTQGANIEIYECSNNGTAATDIDLDGYQQQQSKALSVPAGQSGITDLSGVTYNPVTGTLFMITNKGPGNSGSDRRAKIYEYSVDGNHIRTIDLVNENDTEDIVHLYESTYAIAEEKLGKILLVNINSNTSSINLANATSSELPNWEPTDGDGIEGVTYDPIDATVYCVTEIPMQLHSFPVNTTPASTLISNCLQNQHPFGTNEGNDIDDLSAIHHLRLTRGLQYLDVDDHFLLLSDESNVLIETDENCTEYSQLQLPVSAFGGTNNTQLEGVTMDDCGNIYVVGEPNHFFVYSNQNLNLNPPATSVHQASTSNNTYTVPTGVLEVGTDYCWRAKNSDECLWSPLWSFQTFISGCTNSNACNYDVNATADDNSCVFAAGCDQCDGNGGVIDNPEVGTVCDDNDACTTNDVIDANCNCTGTFQDTDGDGVCNANDQCLGGDDNIDNNNNGIPDACEDACPTDLIITNADVSGDYEASNSIETDPNADVTVNSGEELVLNAGAYVELNQGFDAKPGADFHAYIEGCTPTNPKLTLTDLTPVRHYPNPFTDKVTLELNLNKDAEASINIIDITGRVIHQNPIQQLTSGNHNINLHTQDWISGTYFYQIFIKENNTEMTKYANGVLVKM